MGFKGLTSIPPPRTDWNARVSAWSPEERIEKEKKFVRRIDLRLLPILVRVKDMGVATL